MLFSFHSTFCWCYYFIFHFIYYFLLFLVSYYPHVLSIWRNKVLYIKIKIACKGSPRPIPSITRVDHTVTDVLLVDTFRWKDFCVNFLKTSRATNNLSSLKNECLSDNTPEHNSHSVLPLWELAGSDSQVTPAASVFGSQRPGSAGTTDEHSQRLRIVTVSLRVQWMTSYSIGIVVKWCGYSTARNWVGLACKKTSYISQLLSDHVVGHYWQLITNLPWTQVDD